MKFCSWCVVVVLMAAVLAGCSNDSADGEGTQSVDTTTSVSSTSTSSEGTQTGDATGSESPVTFRPVEALLTLDDMPAGYIEIESAPGEGICDFRLVELASNGSRATFQSGAEDEFLEHVVLIFDDDAEDAMGQFTDVAGDCGTTQADRYTLSVAPTEVDGLDADEVTAVEVTSESGEPQIRALTIVARDGDEIISVTGSRSDRVPRESVVTAATRALEILRDTRANSE